MICDLINLSPYSQSYSCHTKEKLVSLFIRINKWRAQVYRFFIMLSLTIPLIGCRELSNRVEINPKMTSADLKTLTEAPSTDEEPQTRETPPPIDTKPTYPKNFYQRVSLSLTENIPIKPFLSELARKVAVDLQLDPSIQSQMFFQATDRPFIEIIQDLCDLTGLRYSVKNMAIRIERDVPYTENYNIQFLNLTRNSQNRISVATDVFAHNGGAATTQGAADNGSNSSVNVETKNDFWAELEGNLRILLEHDMTESNPSSSSKTPPTRPTSSHKKATYSVHKQGGLITIFATEKIHRRVQNYLNKLKISASSQVLIEAKIIEVTLKEEYRSGINWQKLGKRNDLRLDNAKFGDAAIKSAFLDPSQAHQNMFSFGASGTTFSAIMNALQEFGHSRTLSSPRLTVMNNQVAILKVAQNQVYFRMNYDKQYSQNVQRENVSISSDIQTVPIGLVMSVQPSIDPETGDIILFLRPTISRLSKSVSDPAVDIAYNANLSTSGENTKLTPSMVPVVEVREIDSVIRLKNTEIGVMGGLMEIRSYQYTNKIPGIGDIPVVNNLFQGTADGDSVVELVIVIKATINKGAPTPNAVDQRLMNDYLADPRK